MRKISSQMAKAKRRRLRRVKVGAAARPAELSQSERVENSHVNYINAHPRFDTLIGALREGITVPEIASWFARSGWLHSVTEKTFVGYIYTYKRLNASMLKDTSKSIDSLVDANKPNVDVEIELNRLLRLQKLRLGVDVKHEITMDKLMPSTVKEVEATHKILESLGKVTGKIANSAGAAALDPNASENTDNLRRIKEDEGQRDKMLSLVNDLAGAVVNAGQKATTTA